MKCDKCNSERIIEFGGKVSDLCNAHYKDSSYNGECPSDIGIGGEDYVDFDYCLDCGKIQGEFPIVDDPKFSIKDEEE